QALPLRGTFFLRPQHRRALGLGSNGLWAGTRAITLASALRLPMARISATPAMTVSPVVAPARAIAPVHEVGAAHLVADDPTNHGADRSKDDRTHAGTNADPFDRPRPGGDWAYTQQGHKGCGGCKTAHGLPLWVRRMMNGTFGDRVANFFGQCRCARWI